MSPRLPFTTTPPPGIPANFLTDRAALLPIATPTRPVKPLDQVLVPLATPSLDWEMLPLSKRKALGRAAVLDLHGFLPPRQKEFVLTLISTSEERDFFIGKMIELVGIVKAMPHSYQTDGQGYSAIVHLHYFQPATNFDWYLIEKDKGGKDDRPEDFQRQAYGFVNLADPDCAESGYISLPELFRSRHPVELDFHWDPKPLGQVKAALYGDDA